MALLRSGTRQTDSSSPSFGPPFVFGATHEQGSRAKGAPSSFTFQPDKPLPSIEAGIEQHQESGSSASASSTSIRTHSFSITPPPSQDTPTSTQLGSPSSRSKSPTEIQLDGIDARISNIDLNNEQTHDATELRDRAELAVKSPSEPSLVSNREHSDGNAAGLDNSFSQLALRSSSITSSVSFPTGGTPLRSGVHLPSPKSFRIRRKSDSSIFSNSDNKLEYRPESELPPSSLYHEAKFQDALKTAQDLVGSLLKVLEGSSSYTDPASSIHTLYHRALPVKALANPAKRIVGLVGDSGVGKSRTINSLLDKENLAKAGSSGAACTCVVTEYHYRHEEDLVIEVERFPQSELVEQFIDLSKAYRLVHTPPKISKANSSEARDIQEDQKALEERAQVADCTFLAAFGARWSNCKQDFVSEEEADAVAKIVRWVREATLDHKNEPGQSTFPTLDLCSSYLTNLTSHSMNQDGRSSWPFIRKIKVFVKAHILSQGLVLVDLPGLRDLNSARLLITQRYLIECDEILAVCQIGRATTDVGVKEVFDLAKKAKLARVSIVCTKSDDIQSYEAEQDWPAEQARDIRMKREAISSLQANKKAWKADLDDLVPDEEVPEEERQQYTEYRAARNEAINQAADQIENAKFDEQQFIVTLRNERVTKELLKSYGKVMKQSPRVFCISNEYYWTHRREPARESSRWIELSSIPEVRKSCLALVAEGQLFAAQHYVSETIPALLQSLDMWVKSGSGSVTAERKQAIQKALTEAEKSLDAVDPASGGINDHTDTMLAQFRSNVFNVMGTQTRPWAKQAERQARMWGSWYHPTYAAFCRHYGDYYTPKAGSHCWNREATSQMVEWVEGMWEITSTANDHLQSDYLLSIENAFSRARKQVEAACNNDGAMKAFGASLRHRRNMLHREMEQVFATKSSAMRTLETYAFSGIRSSIIGELMEDTYVRCMLDRGTGVDARRKDLIESAFGNPQLFADHRQRFFQRYTAIVHGLEEALTEKVEKTLAQIQADIEILRADNIITESENNPRLRTQLAKAVDKTRGELGAVRTTMRI